MGEESPQIGPDRSLSGSTPHCLPGGVRDAFSHERNRLDNHLSKPDDMSSRRTPGILKQYKFYLGRYIQYSLLQASSEILNGFINCFFISFITELRNSGCVMVDCLVLIS
jgi:hypothetical protein